MLLLDSGERSFLVSSLGVQRYLSLKNPTSLSDGNGFGDNGIIAVILIFASAPVLDQMCRSLRSILSRVGMEGDTLDSKEHLLPARGSITCVSGVCFPGPE